MIYLDSAATSLLKPDTVQHAMVRAMNNFASPGRGSHAPALGAAGVCYECRERAARLFNVKDPENVVFTFNATHALNIAINTLVPPGGRVAVSGYEHNSVMRPLRALGAELTVIDTPLFEPAAFIKRLGEVIRSVDAVVCTHVSNVFGYILPVYEAARLCRRYGKPLIVDASQSAGVLRVDARALGADFIAMPGHKGLLGPQGTGILICKNEAKPLLYGGSGSDSRKMLMPDYLPDKLEAGTHNVPGIAGLCEGLKFIEGYPRGRILKRERLLLETFCRELSGADARIYKSRDAGNQCGVLSVVPNTMGCDELAEALSEEGVVVRAGLHCAPRAHETAGTADTGTVRFSFSPLVSEQDAARAGGIAKKIIGRAVF